MSFLSNRVMQLNESETLAMSRKANELKEKGINVINMSLGEPDFNTPDYIKTAAKEAIDKNCSFYTPVAGNKDLLEAICAKLKRDNGLTYKPSQVVVSTGAKQSIANVVLAVVNPGDEVVLATPYWVSYAEVVQFAGGKVVEAKATIEDEFKLRPEVLEKAITDKTKLFIFSSPCNPTGALFTQEDLNELAKVLRKHPNVLILSDEIYEYINFLGKNPSMAAFPELYDRVITINGMSKGYAMTGWRLGYMAANEEIAKACVKIQGQFTSGASSISQKAAVAGLKADPAQLKEMVDTFKRRRDLIVGLMKEIPGIRVNWPEGAFYLFPQVSSYFGKSFNGQVIKDSKDLCMFLLNEGHVALTPGAAFGAPDCLRLSYATSDELIVEACKRVKETLKKLN